MSNINNKIEVWKKRLLDLGKRNRLINFKETKRSNVTIVSPNFNELFDLVVTSEKALKFPYAKKIKIDDEGEEFYDAVVDGDLETKQTLSELQKTLKVLRAKAKMSIEEQGINTLYLAFGLLKWTESDISTQVITSPIILVPVSLSIESISSPYILQLHEDEIIVNPTLTFKLENDCGIKLPEFDSNESKIGNYLKSISKIIENENWEVVGDVNLTLLSFLKINMYKDLERNEERITNNQIITAIAGGSDTFSLPSEYNNYDHDKFIRPIDTFQVVDADSSQQDAILLSKNRVSFVLQGPPGTGKSQTITNIISEALADGKKVLFVSEKMAALQVVHKRLELVGLSNFCLTLHSHKANKKEILSDLANTLNMTRTIVKEEALYQLNILQNKRDKLNEYHKELHTVNLPLGKTIFDTNGILASLHHVPEVIFEIKNVDQTTPGELNDRKYLLDEFSKTVGKMSEDFSSNAWYNAVIDSVTYELRHDIDANLKVLSPQLLELADTFTKNLELFDLQLSPTISHVDELIEILSLSGNSPRIPTYWITDDNLTLYSSQAESFLEISEELQFLKKKLSVEYDSDLFEINANELRGILIDNLKASRNFINSSYYIDDNNIIDKISAILNEATLVFNTLNDINVASEKLTKELGFYQRNNTITDIRRCTQLLLELSNGIKPTIKWFETKNRNSISEFYSKAVHFIKTIEIEEYKLYCEIGKLTKYVSENYDETILSNNAKNTVNLIELSIKVLMQLLNSNKSHIVTNFHLVLGTSIYLENVFCNLEKTIGLVCADLGITLPSVYESTTSFYDLLCNIIKNPKPTEIWFNTQKKKEFNSFVEIAKSIQIEINDLSIDLFTDFERDILEIDFDTMLIRFRTEYTSIFKIFNSNYNKDKKLIQGLKISHEIKLKDKDIIILLLKLKKLKDKKQWIIDNNEKLSNYFGSYFDDGVLFYNELGQSIVVFDLIQSYFKGKYFPDKLKSNLTIGLNDNNQIENSIELISKFKSNNISRQISALQKNDIDNYSFIKVVGDLKKIIAACNQLKISFDLYENSCLNTKNKLAILDDINQVSRLQELSLLFEKYNLNTSKLNVDLDINASSVDCSVYIESKNWLNDNKILINEYFNRYSKNEIVDWFTLAKDIESFVLTIVR